MKLHLEFTYLMAKSQVIKVLEKESIFIKRAGERLKRYLEP